MPQDECSEMGAPGKLECMGGLSREYSGDSCARRLSRGTFNVGNDAVDVRGTKSFPQYSCTTN